MGNYVNIQTQTKVQTAKNSNTQPSIFITSTYYRLPKTTVLIIVLSILHAASNQTHCSQEYLHQLLVDQYKYDCEQSVHQLLNPTLLQTQQNP